MSEQRRNLFDDEPPPSATQEQPRSESTGPRANLFAETPAPPPPARTLGPAQPKVGFAQPFGELKVPDLNYTDWIKSKGQDVLMAAGFLPYNAGRLSHGLTDVTSTLVPPVGGILSTLNMQHAASRGHPGQAVLHGIGAIPAGRLAGRVIRGIPTRSLAEIPSERELAKISGAAYDRIRQAPVHFAPTARDDALDYIRTRVSRDFDPQTAPATFARINDPAGFPPGLASRPGQYDALRQKFGKPGVPATSDSAAGAEAKRALDDWLRNQAPRHVAYAPPGAMGAVQRDVDIARGHYAPLKRSQTITGRVDKSEVAAERAVGGKPIDESTHQWLTGLLNTKTGRREMAGFTPAERELVNEANRSDITTRLMRGASNLAGPKAAAGATAAVAGGSHFLGMDPITSGVLATGVGGTILGGGHMLGRAAEGRTARAAEEIATELRKRSPVYQARVAHENAMGGPPLDPLAMQRDAITYALLPQIKQQALDWRDQAYTPYENR